MESPSIIIFETSKWNKWNATIWLYNNGYIYHRIDETNKYYIRFIQHIEVGKYINKKMDNGIEFVIKVP
uniref:Uncharacterized protein n=1 Tax=viral metagenome TaxID=1070528 RepID=A0A6C0EVF4_9ZZZZ